MDKHNGICGNNWSISQAFYKPCDEVILLAEEAAMVVGLRYNFSWFTDDIIVPRNFMLFLKIKADGFKVKNRSSGDNASYTISGIHYI